MVNANALNISANIFRAYDIRGIAGETLTEEVAYSIGQAIGSVLREKQGKKILLARDGRLSGPQLIKALGDGLMAVGCEVYDLGMVPTPVLYYATKHFPERSGIMLTGSHNPPNYNGMKIVINGQTLAEEAIMGLYHRIVAQNYFVDKAGTYQPLAMEDNYLQDITKSISLKRTLKVVVDAGNGVSGQIAPKLFKALGCEVIELYCDIDGTFPNHHPDPSEMKNLQPLIAKVHEIKADVGFAFDGDGDRLGVITNRGEIILPDRLLILFAIAMLKQLPHAKVIYDVKCTNHLDSLIKAANGEPIMWKTGHSLIKVKMAEIDAKLGGE